MLKRYQSSFTHLTARISNFALESPYYPADHIGTDCSG